MDDPVSLLELLLLLSVAVVMDDMDGDKERPAERTEGRANIILLSSMAPPSQSAINKNKKINLFVSLL